MERLLLVGTEQIQTAANTMREAAHTMGNVSGNLQVVLEANQRFLDDWLLRFEQVLNGPASRRDWVRPKPDRRADGDHAT
jgi:hypothetical protein